MNPSRKMHVAATFGLAAATLLCVSSIYETHKHHSKPAALLDRSAGGMAGVSTALLIAVAARRKPSFGD